MMVLAKSTGKLPSPKKYSKRRDAERTYGWEVSQPIQGFLNEGMLMKIQTGLESAKLSRGFPNFLASIQMSVLAGDTTIYVAGPVRVQVDHTEADDFIVDAIESSGIQHSKREAIASVVGKLRQKMSTDARFYIHGIGFSSYEYKDK